jgi:hypothetical protein
MGELGQFASAVFLPKGGPRRHAGSTEAMAEV